MNKKQLMLVGVALIGFSFLVGGRLLNTWHNRHVKTHPKMYVYHTFWGPANAALILEGEKHKDDLIAYYQKVEKEENPTFDFPLKTLPQYEPVYLICFSEDSLLAKVVSYYDYGAFRGGSYTTGWVYAKCLHVEPPPKKDAEE